MLSGRRPPRLRGYAAEHLTAHPGQRTESTSQTRIARRDGVQDVPLTQTLRDLPGEVLVA